MSTTGAVIVAAGKGARMGANVDKLFLDVAGRPIIAHTWAAFDSCSEINEIVLVIRTAMQADFDEIAVLYGFEKPFRYAAGGAERQNSVWNGLLRVSPGTDFVAIQDGARPCTTHQIIRDCLAAARQTGASVAAQRVTDTIKEADGSQQIARNLDRSKLWAVQTPQVFRTEIIKRALGEALKSGVSITDDTAACELIGQPVRLVESATPNPKATCRADLAYINLVLEQQAAARR